MDLCYILSKQEFNHSEPLGALASAGVVKVLIKCPAASSQFFGAILNLKATAFGNTTGGATFIEVCEAPTTSSDGTARTPVCKNRLDTPPSTSIGVFLNTDATGGTVMNSGYTQLGVDYDSPYFILKPATNYLVRATNQTAGALVNGVISLALRQVPNFDQMYHKDDD